MPVDQKVQIGFNQDPIDETRDVTVKLGVIPPPPPPLDLPTIAGIALAVVDAALIVYAVATHIST